MSNDKSFREGLSHLANNAMKTLSHVKETVGKSVHVHAEKALKGLNSGIQNELDTLKAEVESTRQENDALKKRLDDLEKTTQRRSSRKPAASQTTNTPHIPE